MQYTCKYKEQKTKLTQLFFLREVASFYVESSPESAVVMNAARVRDGGGTGSVPTDSEP